MAEHQIRDALAKNGQTMVADNSIQLNSSEAAVVFAFQRAINCLSMESKQLAECYGMREAAGELASAVEHLDKAAKRFIAQSQTKIIVPRLELK